jgi:hypothetical protein
MISDPLIAITSSKHRIATGMAASQLNLNAEEQLTQISHTNHRAEYTPNDLIA